jgi:hypothetical protein
MFNDNQSQENRSRGGGTLHWTQFAVGVVEKVVFRILEHAERNDGVNQYKCAGCTNSFAEVPQLLAHIEESLRV